MIFVFTIYEYYMKSSSVNEKVIVFVVLSVFFMITLFITKRDYKFLRDFILVKKETSKLTIDFKTKEIYNGKNCYSFNDIVAIKTVYSDNNNLMDHNQSSLIQRDGSAKSLLYLITKNNESIYLIAVYPTVIEKMDYSTLISLLEKTFNAEYLD